MPCYTQAPCVSVEVVLSMYNLRAPLGPVSSESIISVQRGPSASSAACWRHENTVDRILREVSKNDFIFIHQTGELLWGL